MKLYTTPQSLKHTLTTVSRIVPGKPSHPILGGILFEATGDKLTMSATDLDQSIKGTVEVEVFEPGRIVVPKRILSVLNTLTDETIILESSGTQLTIQYSKNKFNLNCFDAEEFPQMPEVTGTPWTMDFDPQKVAFAAAKEQARPIFTTVHLNLQDGDVIATDTNRLALIKTTAMEDGKTYNIQAEFLAKIPMGAVLKFGENMVAAEHDSFVFSSRLIDGTYPNYKMIFSDEFSTKIKVSSKDLIRAVQLAKLIKDYAKFEIFTDTVTVSAESEDGSQMESIAAEVEGDSLTIWLNNQYLLDALRCCPEEVILGFRGPLSPVTVMPGGEWQGIVLPVRVME